ncbi:MAG: hypothetical protein H7145_22880 [Akkermansiaceae bacterium]|nr:hypothetical protein [Armatimonadota bacterium]
MQSGDKDLARTVRKELSRRALDITEVQVSCVNGLVHLNGRVKPLPGRVGDFDAEMDSIQKSLRTNSHIREVIFEWQTPYQSTGDKMKKDAARK